MSLILGSDAFAEGGQIPRRYTCEGDDVSPPLTWQGAPSRTATFALVVDDPDAPAGTWIHWVLLDVPDEVTELPENASGAGALPAAAVEGRNSWGRGGYRGPCPPSGTHRYFFRLYALDGPLGLGPGATLAELTRAMEGHVVDEAVLMGRYARG